MLTYIKSCVIFDWVIKMHGIIKAMLIKELIEKDYVIGYQFKKTMNATNIVVSNGAIFYNLKNFEDMKYVYTKMEGKSKKYILTPLGKKEFTKHLDLVPKNIEITMQELGSQIPFIDWTKVKDVSKFSNSIEKLNVLIKQLLEEIK